MPHIRGGKGAAVVNYCKPLATLQRRINSGDEVSSAFPTGKQNGIFLINGYLFHTSVVNMI